MYPHERSLVEKFKGRPFAIVGVNTDSDRTDLKKTIEKEKITWLSFWDGGSTNGPIATKWNIHAFPTVYVLDHKGVIRATNAQGEGLERLLERLVGDADRPAKRP